MLIPKDCHIAYNIPYNKKTSVISTLTPVSLYRLT